MTSGKLLEADLHPWRQPRTRELQGWSRRMCSVDEV